MNIDPSFEENESLEEENPVNSEESEVSEE